MSTKEFWRPGAFQRLAQINRELVHDDFAHFHDEENVPCLVTIIPTIAQPVALDDE